MKGVSDKCGIHYQKFNYKVLYDVMLGKYYKALSKIARSNDLKCLINLLKSGEECRSSLFSIYLSNISTDYSTKEYFNDEEHYDLIREELFNYYKKKIETEIDLMFQPYFDIYDEVNNKINNIKEDEKNKLENNVRIIKSKNEKMHDAVQTLKDFYKSGNKKFLYDYYAEYIEPDYRPESLIDDLVSEKISQLLILLSEKNVFTKEDYKSAIASAIWSYLPGSTFIVIEEIATIAKKNGFDFDNCCLIPIELDTCNEKEEKEYRENKFNKVKTFSFLKNK